MTLRLGAGRGTTSDAPEASHPRVAIVCDEDCFWYVRRIAFSKYDHTRNEVTYLCDQPIGTS
jgi:hypothetical protein